MQIIINQQYDFLNADQMEAFNTELHQYTESFGWSYNTETRILDLDIPDEVDAAFLEKYGELLLKQAS